METEPKKLKGFAAMSVEQRKEYARKGGLTVSQDKARMSEIGKRGQASLKRNAGAEYSNHMKTIAKRGWAKKNKGVNQ